MEFKMFPKITRYTNMNVIITEKIDGSNGCIIFEENGDVHVQSRRRFITPNDRDHPTITDNFGFAAWVHENRDELFEFFGPGRHYGEWWGEGIQSNPYEVEGRYFSPFNTSRFQSDAYWAGHFPDNVTYVPQLAACQLADLNTTVEWCTKRLQRKGTFLPNSSSEYSEGLMVYFPSFNDYSKLVFGPYAHKYEAQLDFTKDRGLPEPSREEFYAEQDCGS